MADDFFAAFAAAVIADSPPVEAPPPEAAVPEPPPPLGAQRGIRSRTWAIGLIVIVIALLVFYASQG